MPVATDTIDKILVPASPVQSWKLTFLTKDKKTVDAEETEMRNKFLAKYAYHSMPAAPGGNLRVVEYTHWNTTFYVVVDIAEAQKFYTEMKRLSGTKGACWSAGKNSKGKATTVPIDRSRVTTDEANRLADAGFTVLAPCVNEASYPVKNNGAYEPRFEPKPVPDYLWAKAAMGDALHTFCSAWMNGRPPRMFFIEGGKLVRGRDRAVARVADDTLSNALAELFDNFY